MTDGYLNTIEGMEQRLREIIDLVIECSGADSTTGKMQVIIIRLDRAIKYEKEIYEIIDRYLAFRPPKHPDFLEGDREYGIKLTTILSCLDSEHKESVIRMREMLENFYCPN